MPAEPEALPPRLNAERLDDLVALYLAEALEHGDLGALGPLQLLHDRVELLIAEHAQVAHDVDGVSWRVVGEALGVTASVMSARSRAAKRVHRPS